MKPMIYWIALSILITPTAAYATPGVVEGHPTSWRLQNYVGDGSMYLFFTGSPCANGNLALPSSASENVKKSFWSLIQAAQGSGQEVEIHYEYSGDTCIITKFSNKEYPS